MIQFISMVINRIVRSDNRVVVLTADNGLKDYKLLKDLYGDRILNYGISEANMVSSAAGLASCGKIPFVFSTTNFLILRAYEQIRNDVCLHNLPVKLIGVGGGVGFSQGGPSHHVLEDIAIMRILPNMNVVCPCGPIEMRQAFSESLKRQEPFYIRLQQTYDPDPLSKDYKLNLDQCVEIKKGSDLTLITTGVLLSDVNSIAESLERQGYSIGVLHIPSISPLDVESIQNIARRTKRILTVEEHRIKGGLGSIVTEILSRMSWTVYPMIDYVGIGDGFAVGYGNYEQIKELNGLSKEQIYNKAITMLEINV